MTLQTFQSNHGPLALGDLSFAMALRDSKSQHVDNVVSPTERYESTMVVCIRLCSEVNIQNMAHECGEEEFDWYTFRMNSSTSRRLIVTNPRNCAATWGENTAHTSTIRERWRRTKAL